MKRFLVTLGLVACVGTTGALSSARAQEIEVEGPLAGAPAVIGLRAYREMRLQIQVHGATTLTDEFSQAIFAGGQLMFHPFDWLGFGVWGGFAVVNLDTSLTDEVTSKARFNENNVLSLPEASAFPDQVGRLKWIAAPQVSFIPLRGKLSVFDSLFIDTDLYLFGGVAFIGLEERADVAAGTCNPGGALALAEQKTLCDQTQYRTSRMAIAPTFGVGLALYMNEYLALTMDWRAFPFAWNTSGTDEVGAPGRPLQATIDSSDQINHFNHLFALGFAFYLPTEPRLTYVEDD